MERSAKYGCPMCGSNKEIRKDLSFSGDDLSVTYECEDCHSIYTIYYNLVYDGFSMGDIFWDINGEMEN